MREPAHILLAELTWTGQRFERNLAVHVDADGTIARVAPADGPQRQPITPLPGRALLPGMVYAHSHAFQRALRNRPERFGAGPGSFWTWRQLMYQLVEALDAQTLYEISRRCFSEMLRAGVTAVGEFHYLHHDQERDWAMDDALLAAARDAGIRIALIQCFYSAGGIGRPLSGAQRRFDGISLEAFLRQAERLRGRLEPGMQTLALACHSVRGAPIDEIERIHRRALDLDVPFHIHVEEQRQEIRDCIEAHGAGPLRLMLRRLPIDEHFTAIHCTHSEAEDLHELASRGGNICLCPSTEGNLADGLPRLREMRAGGARIAVGSDCNLRLCMSEDLRWLEYVHRLANETSGIVTDEQGLVAPALFELATINGAACLRLPLGTIAVGQRADLFTLDLRHPALSDAGDDSLMHAFIFGSGNGPIDQVWVRGRPVAASSGSA